MSHIPPYCEATDLSAPERRYGSVLLRCGPNGQLEAFLRSGGEALPSLTCSFMETERTAACRWFCNADKACMRVAR